MKHSPISVYILINNIHLMNQTDTTFVGNNLTDEQKQEVIATHFKSIMETLGLNLQDDSLE